MATSRVHAPGAQRFIPPEADLNQLREAAPACRGCDLYRQATQVVFSAGPPDAPLVLVGEQPGDVEDKAGEPFVGPAGALLTKALDELGVGREGAYLTNAVKHFKFRLSPRGKRRIHDKPDRIEITACRPWLVAELAVLRPRVVVALGATAAGALMGPAFRVTRSRGELLPWPASAYRPGDFPEVDPPALFMATVHPSAVLRSDDRAGAYRAFAADLAVAVKAAA
ncbi:UdgX family uracil-DNA binding protein [Luedemannella helvata]|uniref:Type-4 uracil-DNA glycosylase n=1 Tax=Luedemannella helvata TaxID=349315 RepID=A0ABP4WUQ6_9ACTN